MRQITLSPSRSDRYAVHTMAVLLGVFVLFFFNFASAKDSETEIGEFLSAVVGVRAIVPSTARTANVLGTERAGTGVVIDSNGLIVTIGYLILEASSAQITLGNGQNFPAKIVAYDHNTGFGLLRAVGPIDARPMTLGQSNDLKESDRVLIFSEGGVEAIQPAVVQSRREFAGYWEYLLENAIFTAPPHPAFGGAALVGAEGTLLGIGSLIVGDSRREGDATVPGNMFVPIDELKSVLNHLLASGRSPGPPRPWLGVYVQEVAEHLLITRVARDGPAHKAGVEPGSIIVGVGGSSVDSLADFYRQVWAQGTAGVEIPLALVKGSKLVNVAVRTGNRYDWLRLNPSY